MANEPYLKACPCGKIPEYLVLEEGSSSKYAWAKGNCCDDWAVEFRTNYFGLDSEEAKEMAAKAWNEASRKEDKTTYKTKTPDISDQNRQAWENL